VARRSLPKLNGQGAMRSGTGTCHSVKGTLYGIDPAGRDNHWFPGRSGNGIRGLYTRYAPYERAGTRIRSARGHRPPSFSPFNDK
jgi:hypothetical protein